MVRGATNVEPDYGEDDFRRSAEYVAQMRKVFAKHLRENLNERGWSQSELARRANEKMPKGASEVTRDNISRYCRADNMPGPERLSAIAKAFGVKPASLIPEEEMMTYDEYQVKLNSRPWDVKVEMDGTEARLYLHAHLPATLALKIMEMVQPHAPGGPDAD